jgi:hypothetical protein
LQRSAKDRAARIDLSYFKRPHLFRSWRFWLSVALPVAGLLWITVSDFAGVHTVYNPGPLSHSHSVFANRCELCHTVRVGMLRSHVSDDACLTCHDGPKHQTLQVSTPACSTCHVEHRGVERIAEVPNSSCTQCHAQLRTTRGTPSVAGSVTLFIANHPEFRAKLADAHDPGTIKLNHAVHLAAGLKGPHGAVQMECGDCHRANPNSGPWPYGTTPPASVVSAPLMRERPQNYPYMLPIKYAQQCAACHALEFDRRFAGEQVPHDKPDVVHKFLVEHYQKLVGEHPAAWHDNSAPRLQRIVSEERLQPARNPDEWVQMQVAAAERLLWQKTCKECHTVPLVTAALPEIPKSAVPVRWMQHAAFNHTSHSLLECEGCHTQSRRSKETSDILLPGIATCRQCHQREKEVGVGADARCSECHVYHDWSRDRRRVRVPYTIPQIQGTAAVPASPAPVGQ